MGVLEEKFNRLGGDEYSNALANGTLINAGDFPPFIPNSIRRIILKSIKSDPTERFQSAREMRRELERLSFPGHWTVDDRGMLIGVDMRKTYRFIHVPAVGGKASFTAFKKHNESGRETKISQFTKKDLTKAEVGRLMKKFQKAVVDGRV